MTATMTQRFTALDRGNEVRIRRAVLKRELKAGERRLTDVLFEPEWWLFSLPVHVFLAWGPRMGSTKASQVLRRAEVWPLRELGALTFRQRSRLVAVLEQREERR